MYNKFWFDTNFFVRNLDVRLELRQHQSLSQRIFSFLDRMVLFLSSLSLFINFFHFFQVLPSAFDFPMSKRSFISIELPRVNFVKWRSKQNMQMTWKTSPKMCGCRENSPRGFARLQDYDTFLMHGFYSKCVFQNNSGAFRDFRNFSLWNVRSNVWIQLSQIKEKSIFSASERRK